MRTSDTGAAVKRLSMLVVVGTAAAVGLGWHAMSVAPVYSAEMTVTLSSPAVTADLTATQPSLILVARLVSASMADRPESRRPSDSVSLAGEGLRHGVSVTVPSSGSQWVRQYQRPELRVQAVGSSPAAVGDELEATMGRVNQELRDLQASFHLPEQQSIRASAIDPLPDVTVSGGSSTRALASGTMLAFGVTTGAAIGLNRRISRVPRRRSGPAVGRPQAG